MLFGVGVWRRVIYRTVDGVNMSDVSGPKRGLGRWK